MDSYKLLEERYAKHLSTASAVSVNTGTAALHISLEALCLPRGSKVIVPDFTMYASALATHYAGLTPVFVDCDDNLLINLDKVEEVIDNQTKVLMVTHIYGRVVDMDRVMSIAKKNNLRVIEDACEAQGAYWKGHPVGSYDIGCFSLYRNKIIHAEEGGIVASDDLQFLEVVEDMKSMSFGKTHDYFHKRIGFNYRMTNSQAAMAIQSLSAVEQSLEKREEIKNQYNLLIDKKNKGLKVRHSFKPMSIQPLFLGHKVENPNAQHYSKNVFYIHIDIDDSFEDIKRKSEILNNVMRELDWQ